MTKAGLTRRQATATAVAAATSPAQAAGRPERPNILWLVSEDNFPFIGAYGDPLARTPTIDRLARDGVLYRHAYAPSPVCAPTRFSILSGVHSESCSPANHMRANAQLPSQVPTYPELMRAAGYYCTNNAKTDYNCDADPARLWNESGREAHWRKRPPGQPFLAVFNYETTHESRLFKTAPGRVRPQDVRVPSYLPDSDGIRVDYASYHNLMEQMDGELAARLAELSADGLADNTIVIYASDNGGVLPRSKRYCYEEGLRVGLVVYAPPPWRHLLPHPPGTAVDAPVSLIDLPPTMLSLAGLEAPATMQGQAFLGRRAKPPRRYAFSMRNRMDERYDLVRTVTDGRWRYIRHYMPHRPWGMHGAYEWQARGYQDWERAYRAGTLNSTQARFFGAKPFEELYDLTIDPDQVRNLATAPEAQRRRLELSRALDRHMLAVNDNGFIPEGLSAEGYVQSQDRTVYPLPRIMALASAAARREPTNAATFGRTLADPNPVVRYWAAMGLLMLAAPTDALRDMAERDPVPQVRVVAAEAAGAVDVLAELSGESHPWPVRLQALNALTALGEASRPALPTIQWAAASDQGYVRSAGRYLAAVLAGTYDPAYPVYVEDRRT